MSDDDEMMSAEVSFDANHLPHPVGVASSDSPTMGAPPAASSSSSSRRRRRIATSPSASHSSDDDNDSRHQQSEYGGYLNGASSSREIRPGQVRELGAMSRNARLSAAMHREQSCSSSLGDTGATSASRSPSGTTSRQPPNAVLPPPPSADEMMDDDGVRTQLGIDSEGVVTINPYPDFRSEYLRVVDPIQPANVPIGKLWAKMTPDVLGEMKPVRAMRFVVPCSLFRRDALNFADMSMPAHEGSGRALGSSALLGALFAGTSMGIPSGNHAERKRSDSRQDDTGSSGTGSSSLRKEKKDDLKDVTRYAYIPESNPGDEEPMFRIAYEEIRSEDESEVTFIGVWLFIFDPYHSTSALLREVMLINNGLMLSQGAASQNPNNRHKGFQNEIERRKKAGFGFSNLNNNFESTVGLQYWRIRNMETYRAMLNAHSGACVAHKGRPFVENVSLHQKNAFGNKFLFGDTQLGHGGFHPLAPEFVFCAKRKGGLEFGAVNLDGSPGNIHPRYLDPATYWNGDIFQLPPNGDMWMCTEIERRTIMDCPLPRPLQNQVTPGDDLMRLFIERTTRPSPAPREETAQEVSNRMRQAAGRPLPRDAPPPPPKPISPEDYARFRSLATGVDEAQRRENESIRNFLQRFDNMDQLLSSSDTSVHRGSKKDMYRIKIEKMTDVIARESNRVYDTLVEPWFQEKKKEIEDLFAHLETNHIDPYDPRWSQVRAKQRDLHERLYKVKEDLAKYHLRSTLQCFHSAHDLTTLPNGYIAMVDALEGLVRQNGDCASLAFPPPKEDGKPRDGMQIMASDRQVWHELQEWLGVIFTKDAHIKGRDRHILDEMYLQSFDVYSNVRFLMIVCSDRGKGKTIRAIRLSKLLPQGFTSFQSASSARAGMNGNMSPSNGTFIVFDEMTSDLTPADCGERLEFWKQVLTNGEYSIERTCRAAKADGSDSYVTCEIVTDHSVAYLVCTNHGPCFTPGDRQPTAGKHAMISRTFTLFARQETSEASPESDFERHINGPAAERVRRFRLFTCLVAFCKMAVRKCQWMQPDMGFAQKTWEEYDRVLTEEYNMPRPQPRPTQRRAEVAATQSLMEAVARVYLYKQTAFQFTSGRPDPDTGHAKKFDVGDLWDVIRTASTPSRAVIRDAWIKSLYYSTATSPHGVNVMTTLCMYGNIGITDLFKKLPTSDLGIDDALLNKMTEEQIRTRAIENGGLPSVLGADGERTDKLKALGKQMCKQRKLRCEWRRIASRSNVSCLGPKETIEEVVRTEKEERKDEFREAMMPNIIDAVLVYEHTNVLRWARGLEVGSQKKPTAGRLKFKKVDAFDTGPAVTIKHDYGWVVVRDSDGSSASSSTNAPDNGVRFGPVAADIINLTKGPTPATLYDYHQVGIVDTLILLESSDASRLCSEMPTFAPSQLPEHAFLDERDAIPGAKSNQIKIRTVFKDNNHTKVVKLPACTFRLDHWPNNYKKVPIHQQLDLMTTYGCLPGLSAFTSAKVIHCPPIRRIKDFGVLINLTVAKQHVEMVLEAPLQLMEIDGLRDHHEHFKNGVSAGLSGFQADTKGGISVINDDPEKSGITTCLPQSVDVVLLAWVKDITDRPYNDLHTRDVMHFNSAIRKANGALGKAIKERDMPQVPMCCAGYPIPTNPSVKNSPYSMLLLSRKVRKKRNDQVDYIEVSDDVSDGSMSDVLLRNEVAVALGRAPTQGDIKAYKQQQKGSSYMWGVRGDLHAFSTWCAHAEASMFGRGFVPLHKDKVVQCMQDSETLLLCKMLERMAMDEDSDAHKYGIQPTTGQTYTAVLRAMREDRDRRAAEALGGSSSQSVEASESSRASKRPLLPDTNASRTEEDNPFSSMFLEAKRMRHGEDDSAEHQTVVETRDVRTGE